MLWNPGPDYRAGLTLANASPTELNACATWGSDMSEGNLVGNATDPTRFSSFPCLPTAVAGSSNAAAPSFYVDTRSNGYGNGWTLADLNSYPGWSVWWESGGSGTPIQFQFLNFSKAAAEPCKLREVGLSYQRWPYIPDSHLRENFAHLAEYKEVNASFKSRVSYSSGPPQCVGFPTADVSADFHITFLNGGKEVVQHQLLGVLLYTQPGMTLPPPPNPVFWEGEVAGGPARLLIGSRLSPAVPTMTPEGPWVNYTIDYKQLIEAYVTPPPGYSVSEAVVGGLDVYTSARGSDLNLQLTDVDLYGVK
ncbi:MAG: hypothetical protein AB7V58_07500 [Solirubrobacterales bacterium]